MRKGHFSRGKKIVSVLLVVMMIFSLMPMISLADSWQQNPPSETDHIYYWNSAEVIPSHDQKLDFIKTLDTGKQAPVKQYILANTMGSGVITTYCSDFAYAPNPYDPSNPNSALLYKRVPIESAQAKEYFKDYDNSTAKLRSILINSDLWQSDISKLEAAANKTPYKVSGLTKDQVIAATQVAIWTLVNGTTFVTNDGATKNDNVKNYSSYLLSLPGTDASQMAQLKMTGATKSLVATNPGLYNALIEYTVDGIGAGQGDNDKFTVDATYKLSNGSPVKIDSSNIEAKFGEIFIKNVPVGATINLSVSGTQDDARSVYLFVPKGGRATSQTLVSVVKGAPLNMTVEVNSPGDLGTVNFAKVWRQNDVNGPVMPNAAVADYKSVFRITYNDPGFQDLTVCDDITITGNGNNVFNNVNKPGFVFEKGKNYKITEIEAYKGGVKLTEGLAAPKYFTIKEDPTDTNTIKRLIAVWTDSNKKVLDPQTDAMRFSNVLNVKTGSVKVQKTLADVTGIATNNDTFTFTAQWKPSDNADPVIYAGEDYTLFTTANGVTTFVNTTTKANGQFTLKINQYALFNNLPAGSTLIINELDDSATKPYYNYNKNTLTAKIPTDTTSTTQLINVVNTWNSGELIVSKKFADNSELNWTYFDGTANKSVLIKVSGPAGFYREINLSASKTSEKLTGIPIGEYTVTDATGTIGTYAHVATMNPADGKATLTTGSSKTVDVTNRYWKARASLTINKSVVNPDGLTGLPASFEFAITDTQGKSVTDADGKTVANVTINTTNGTGSVTINNLVPGTYRVKELDPAVPANTTVEVKIGKGTDVLATGKTVDVVVSEAAVAIVNVSNTYKALLGSIKITKTLTDNLKVFNTTNFATLYPGVKFTFDVKDSGGNVVATRTLPTAAGNWNDTVSNLKADKYTVVERDIPTLTGYGAAEVTPSSAIANAEIKDNATAPEVTFNNKYTYPIGSIDITKIIAGTWADANDKFSFVIKATLNNKAYTGKCMIGATEYTFNASGQFTYADATGTAAGKTFSITGLPVGAVVTVTEQSNSNYTLTSVVPTDGSATVSATTTPNVKFTNTAKTIDLTINKTMSGAAWPTGGIVFEITGPTGWTTTQTGMTYISAAKYQFTLTSAKTSITIAGAKPGTYKIREVSGHDITAYDRTTTINVSITGATYAVDGTDKTLVTISNVLQSGTVTYTNSYTGKTGGFTVKKNVADAKGGPLTDRFTFTATFTPALANSPLTRALNAVNGESFTTVGSTSTLIFTLAHNETATFTGIPVGTHYKITENASANYEANAQILEGDYTGASAIPSITFNNTRKTGSLEISKTLTGGDSFDGTFEFQVLIGSTPCAGITIANIPGVTQTNSAGKFSMKAGQTAKLTGLPLGVIVTVKESTHSYFTATAASQDVTIIADSKVAFENTRKTFQLSAKKVIAGPAVSLLDEDQIYTFTITKDGAPLVGADFIVNGVADKTIAGGKFSIKATEIAIFAGLPAGFTYKVTEDETMSPALPDGVTCTYPAAWEVKNFAANASNTFTNTFNYAGSLIVSKEVANTGSYSVPADKSFTFQLKKDGVDYTTSMPYKLTSGQNVTDETATNGKFTLMHGEIATFASVPNGTWTVTETGAEVAGFDVVTTANPASATVPTTSEIKVKNTYNRTFGDLDVTKKLNITPENADISGTQTFKFTIYNGTDATGTPAAGLTGTFGLTGTNYTAAITTDATGSFTLKGGETASFTDLPTGNYFIVESGYAIDGYTRVATDLTEQGIAITSKGDIEESLYKAQELTFTNSYNKDVGSLTVTKASVEHDGKADSTWSYDFTIAGPNLGSSLLVDGVTFIVDNGAFNFTLSSAAPSVTLTGLPAGSYTVTENNADEEYYTLSTSYQIGEGAAVEGSSAPVTLVKDTSAEIKFSNSYTHNNYFTLRKEISGSVNVAESAADVTFDFTLTGPENCFGDGKNVLTIPSMHANDTYYYKDYLAPGTYTLKEINPPNLSQYSFAGMTFALDKGTATAPDADGNFTFEISERGQSASVVCVNDYVKDGGILKVTKNVDGYANTGENGDYFTFQVTGLATNNPVIIYTPGEAIPVKTSVEPGGIFSIKAGQTAVITELSTNTDYTVTEINSSTGNFTFTKVEGKRYHQATDGEPAGVETLTGDNTIVNGMTAAMGAKTDAGNPVLDFTFTNSRATGELDVTKTANGPLHTEGGFTASVTFTHKKDAIDARELIGSLKVDGRDVTTEDFSEGGVLHIKIMPEETCKITGIPTGLGYSISEIQAPVLYSVKYLGDEGTIIADQIQSCTIENTRLFGELTISKDVMKLNDHELTSSNEFKIVVTFSPFERAFNETDLVNGFESTKGSFALDGKNIVFTVKLMSGELVDINKIPVGTSYVIDEILDDDQALDYVKFISEYDGIVDVASSGNDKYENNKDSVSIINFNIPFNSLLVTKDVTATNGSPLNSHKFDFNLELSKPGANTDYTNLEIQRQIEKVQDMIRTAMSEKDTLDKAYTTEERAAYNTALELLRTVVGEDGKITEDAKKAIIAACETCKGTGTVESTEKVPCTADGCVDGKLHCDVCNDTREVTKTVACPGYFDEETQTQIPCTGDDTCTVCGGALEIEETVPCTECPDCPDCDNGMVDAGTIDCPVCAAAIADAVAEALADFNATELNGVNVVDKHNAIEAIKERIAKLNEILTDLNANILIEFDAVTLEITRKVEQPEPGQEGPAQPPFVLTNDMIKAFRLVGTSEQTLSLESVSFTANDDGTYSFKLAKGEFIQFMNLPEGTKYKVTEVNIPTNIDPYDGTTVTGGTVNTDTSASGTIVKDSSGYLIKFLNKYKTVLGSLGVTKVWTNDDRAGNTSVTVMLLDNDVATGKTLVLNAANNWSGTFNDLELGHVYSVRETPVPTGFTVTYTPGTAPIDYGNRNSLSITVTNTRTTTTDTPTTSTTTTSTTTGGGGTDRDRGTSTPRPSSTPVVIVNPSTPASYVTPAPVVEEGDTDVPQTVITPDEEDVTEDITPTTEITEPTLPKAGGFYFGLIGFIGSGMALLGVTMSGRNPRKRNNKED